MTTMFDLDSGMDEPTLAADLEKAETQSIYAWSQVDDTPTVIDYQPKRSWRLPASLLALTAAAVTIGGVAVWPHHHTDQTPTPTHSATKPQENAPKPQVAPKPESKDDRYTRLLQESGITVTSTPELTGAQGRGICQRLATGETINDMASDIIAGTPGITRREADIWIDMAMQVYCPR